MVRNSLVIGFIFILGILMFYLGLQTGSFETTPSTVTQALFNYNPESKIHFVIINLRLPRILLAFLVGAALSLSGYIMQAMVNNPLAEPYILGTASGASLGANLAYLVAIPVGYLNIFLPSIGAFVGAVSVTLLAIAIAYDKGQFIPAKLLLAGVALSSFLVSIISLIIYITDDDSKLKSIIYWSMGSFEKAQWEYLPLLFFSLAISVILFIYLNKHLTILLMGETRSYNLGVDVKKLRWLILIIASLLTGLSVAASGPIGFVGLIIPHFIRGLFGVHGRLNIFYCAIIGGIFMLSCEVVSRLLFKPVGIPIGIITSFLGIPFFVYLLTKKNYRFS